MSKHLRVFGLTGTRRFSDQLAASLDVELAPHEERYFDDHEPYLRSEVNVRDCDVFVVQSLYQDGTETVADKFAKLLFFVGSLRDASAGRITAVIPYMAFSRQDRKVMSREPITTKYTAKLLEAVGADRILTMDVHSLSALQNAFRIPTDNLEAKNLLADHVAAHICTEQPITVLSPDSGGMGRAKRFRKALAKRMEEDIGLAYLDKTHDGTRISGESIIGDVRGRQVVVLDDMISSGSTLAECHKAVRQAGGFLWGACATHGLFVGRANQHLADIPRLVVADTIQSASLSPDNAAKVATISTADMFGRAIRIIHEEGGSISDLLR